MKPANRKTLLITAGITALIVSFSVQSMPPHGGHGMGGHAGGDLFLVERMAQRLELDDAQRTQVESLMDMRRKAARPLVRTLVQAERELREARHAAVLDEALVRRVAERRAAAMVEMTVLRARTRHAVHALLTPEQRQNMHEHMGRRHQARARMHGRGRDAN